jgi:hypothetical protein
MPGFIGIDGWWWLYFDIAELSSVSERHRSASATAAKCR